MESSSEGEKSGLFVSRKTTKTIEVKLPFGCEH